MIKLLSFPTSIGLENTTYGVKGAQIVAGRKGASISELFTFKPESDHVKRLYIHHPFLTTALEGKEILVRSLRLPLTKEKDIELALAFQAEPLLPYPIEQALLAYQITSKTPETTDLTLLAVRKEAIQSHLELWQNHHIVPEKVGSIPSALCQFGTKYLSTFQTYLILHLQNKGMTCVLIKEGKLLASFGQSEGLELLLNAQIEDNLPFLPQNEKEWQSLDHQKQSSLSFALKRLQKEMTKVCYALAKEFRGEQAEGIFVTGEAADYEGLSEILVQHFPFPLLKCEECHNHSSQQLSSFAVAIGLALNSLPGSSLVVDFRQQEYRFPFPWRRLRSPLITYFGSMILLSLAFSFFGQNYLQHREDTLRQSYVDLLSKTHQTHEQFEKAFYTKHGKGTEKISSIGQLQKEDIEERLSFLQKELLSTPDSFPLFANIPRVSDLLAWLSQHPAIISKESKEAPQTRLQIENLSYTMLKRPQQGKKQEKYQIKVELEFTSPTPKWAREFHDALIAPNDWVDPKGEVKWSSNRGKYKTSFFLKDKTIYPSF